MLGSASIGAFSLFKSFLSLFVSPLLVLAFSFSSGANAYMVASDAVRPLPKIDFAGKSATADARIAAHWVATNADNQRLPFVIVDKKNAQIFVFDANRQLKGTTPVLLGLTVGDDGLTDMSSRKLSSLALAEKTTPSGRFLAEPGRNLQGEEIIWLDYAAKLAIHRLRPDYKPEHRAKRLATASVADNRISLGCVIVSVAFYETVIRPVLGKSHSVVYVLPETRPLQGMLNTLQSSVH